MTLFTVLTVAFHVLAPAAPAGAPMQLALEAEKEYVYCADGRTTIETWDIAQMHVRYGQDVCLLHEGNINSSAADWMAKNFPTGKCSC